MANAIVTKNYNGTLVVFNEEGWLNATDYAVKHGKRVDVWLRNQETSEYISALCEISNTTKNGYLKTRRGNNGGTWLHPKLAVMFARWLDPRFAIWCDTQIDGLIRGKTNWRTMRHASASTTKMANDLLKLVRESQGKGTESHHYSNEARMVNWALTGDFCAVDRDQLPSEDLDLLAYLQERNAVLIGRGLSYEQRKPVIKQYAMDWRMPQLPLLP